MSARETHPIDDRFRQMLAGAEVTPPPSVWENIQRERRPRRLLPPWFQLNSILLVLLPLVGFTTYMLWPTDNGSAATEPRITASVTNSASAGTTLHVESSDGAVPSAEVNAPSDVSGQSIDPDGGGSHGPSTSNEPIGEAIGNGGDPPQISSNEALPFGTPKPNDRSVRSNSSDDGSPATMMGGDPALNDCYVSEDPAIELETPIVLRMDPLRVRPGPPTIEASPLTPVMPPAYVLPPADWVFSIGFMRYDLQRRWKGTDEDLVSALERSEANTSTYALGLGIARHWRSGLGIGIGVQHERSEQQFRFTEEQITIQQQVNSFIVTLDTDVFYASSDTIEQVTTSREEHEGLNRRSVIRIPVDGYYHWSRGRWMAGPRLGVAVEFTRVEQDRSITLDREEGQLRATKLTGKELRERHPVTLHGQLGLDLGFTINERWSIRATPTYLFPAMPLTRTAEAWTAPHRFGAGLQLSYHFTPKN